MTIIDSTAASRGAAGAGVRARVARACGMAMKLALATLVLATSASAQDVFYEETVKLASSAQNFRSNGLCMRASHQEPKGTSVPATVEECTNSTWYPYRFIAFERWHLSLERYYVIKLRTRQDLCLDVDESTRSSDMPSVIMAPCAINGTNFHQYWSPVPIKNEYSEGGYYYLLINAGATSSKGAKVLTAGPAGGQLLLTHHRPGPVPHASNPRHWTSVEFWCQMQFGTHVDGWVYPSSGGIHGSTPLPPYPHCVQ